MGAIHRHACKQQALQTQASWELDTAARPTDATEPSAR